MFFFFLLPDPCSPYARLTDPERDLTWAQFLDLIPDLAGGKPVESAGAVVASPGVAVPALQSDKGTITPLPTRGGTPTSHEQTHVPTSSVR